VEKFPEAGLAAGREALRRFLAGDDDIQSMLTKMTLIATETIPGTTAASITMMAAGQPRTPAYTEKRALELDNLQYELGDGPCLSAISHHGVEHVQIAQADRWPTFSVRASEEGIAAVLSAPISDGEETKGALNLYSEGGFGPDAEDLACLFADQLGIAAVNTTLYVEAKVIAEQLRQALESRAAIEQAKGILMAAERCGPEEAFEILKRASQNRNEKLRDIAAEIVRRYSGETGTSTS
jgi:GAF domain-containing protein